MSIVLHFTYFYVLICRFRNTISIDKEQWYYVNSSPFSLHSKNKIKNNLLFFFFSSIWYIDTILVVQKILQLIDKLIRGILTRIFILIYYFENIGLSFLLSLNKIYLTALLFIYCYFNSKLYTLSSWIVGRGTR